MRNLIVTLLLLCSCASVQAPLSSDDAFEQRCRNLEDEYQLWGGLGAAAGAIAASGALTTALPDDKDQRLVLGMSSAIVVSFGAAAIFIRDDILDIYEEECGMFVETSTTGE